MSDVAWAVSPTIFRDLQDKIDEDVRFRDELTPVLQALERQDRQALVLLSRAHSTPSSDLSPVFESLRAVINEEVGIIGQLDAIASRAPYFRYNNLWSRDVQNAIFVILYSGWLGAALDLAEGKTTSETGRLFSLEEVGNILRVPVNLKDRDAFHLTIEEYLQALISLVEELARLAINSVTLGDYRRPLEISRFVKDVHGGFQILNLKNDALRRRSDSIKYNVKKVEDIVYDLSLRNLVARS